MLTASLAQEIARETSAVIGFNVLVTDRDGQVIGSGDERRVGSFHEASIQVVGTGRPATHTGAEASALAGVRPGVTFPVVHEGAVVGTVGITGSPSRVRRFGLVVQRQTEILLEESRLLSSRLLRERATEELLRDVAAYDPEVLEPEHLAFRASELGYDLDLPRVVVVLAVRGVPQDRTGDGVSGHQRDGRPAGSTDAASSLRSSLLRCARQHLADPQDVVGATAAGRFVALRRVPSPSSGEESAARDVLDLARLVTVGWWEGYGVTARSGVGSVATSVSGLHDSYQEAWTAVRLGERLGSGLSGRIGDSSAGPGASGGSAVWIGDLRIEEMLAAVGRRTRARFSATLAGPLRAQGDWDDLRATLVAWCESGFSLVRAAESLHVHRNTLVYRLRKIERLTGRDTRDHRATLALYLACLADGLDDAS